MRVPRQRELLITYDIQYVRHRLIHAQVSDKCSAGTYVRTVQYEHGPRVRRG